MGLDALCSHTHVLVSQEKRGTMQRPLQITFRNMDHSPAVEADVRQKADKLDEYHHNVIGCRVVIEGSHHHHHKGNLYQAKLDITVPGHEVVVSRARDQHHAHEDVYVAVRDAFNAAYRQLEDIGRKMRGAVKAHETPPHGRIVELVPDEGFGRVETPDGRRVYFHRNSVLNADFDGLSEGDEVRFDEEAGDKGRQASTVRVIGKHHIVG